MTRTFLFAAALLLCGPVAAQPMCAPYPAVAAHLAGNFDERPVGGGAVDNGMAAQFFASPAGTWTFVLIRPDGVACMIAAGQGWEPAPKKPGKDA
jgi:hypothetical protein